MADRFWVGGGANTGWTATGNTNWAATSGGANNASVPGVGDRCIFDANSGVATATISNNITVQSVNCTGYAGTITHGAFTLTLNTAAVDTFLLVSGMTYTASATTSIVALTHTSGTADITTAGKRLGALTINGVGGTTRLLDDLRVDAVANAILTLTNGVFNANGFAVTTHVFAGSNSNTRTLTLGNGLWTIGGNTSNNTTIWTLATVTGLTFNKGTSNIVIATTVVIAGQRSFLGGALTYNDLTVNSNSSRGAIVLGGGSTFANIFLAAGTYLQLNSAGTTIISNAPTWTGTLALPISIQTSAVNAQATLSVPSGTLTLSYGVLQGIATTGGAAFVADNTYDLGNNTAFSITPPVAMDAAGIRSAIGMASANLDTQIATLATPTNITAGTITTVTNLTNAPTVGDLTAAMKASVTTAASAATPSVTVSGTVNADIKKVNGVTVNGNGAGTPWGP